MARGVPLLSLVLAFLVGGLLWSAQVRHSPGAQANRQIDQAQQAVTAVTFQQAEVALEQFRALNGTYVGASLAGFGVKLARTDASSYCVQAGGSHLAGPGGAVAPGPC
jgi:ABC-type amino acid transport system permease subunit